MLDLLECHPAHRTLPVRARRGPERRPHTAAARQRFHRAAHSADQASGYEAPHTADGTPDLNGIWQALGSAHWDIEGHAARPGPIVELGAVGAIPGGLGIVAGGEIPYQDEAASQKQENFDNWLTAEP